MRDVAACQDGAHVRLRASPATGKSATRIQGASGIVNLPRLNHRQRWHASHESLPAEYGRAARNGARFGPFLATPSRSGREGFGLKTVRDMLIEALAMKREGLAPSEIARWIVDIGHANGFPAVVERSYSVTGLELLFEATGEIIRFDGRDWHHVRT